MKYGQPFKDLREFLGYLEEKGELIKIKREVNPKFEIAAILEKSSRERGPAVFFEKIMGYEASVAGQILGTRKRLAFALGIEETEIVDEYLRRKYNLIPPTTINIGPVKEVIESEVDILKVLPVLTHHEKDAGPYITAGTIITKKIDGIRGFGIHRVQVKSQNKLGVFLAMPPASELFKKAELANEPLEIAIAIGLEPVTLFASVILAPRGPDKFEIAGALRNKPVELIKCETVDVEIPAYAEVVIEGKVLPNIREPEGPFGESTGYYLAYNNPVIHVSKITHRDNLVYQAILPWSSEDSTLFTCWEVDIYEYIKRVVPAVKAFRLTTGTCGLNAIIVISKSEDTEARQALLTALSYPLIKHAMVVDDDVNVDDPFELNWALATRFQGDEDLIILPKMRGFEIDPSTKEGYVTTKVGINCTKPVIRLEKFEKIRIPKEVTEKVRKNWIKYIE